MMSGQNIVCFANDWESDPTSKHQVMKILARSNRVLWVNSIGLRRPGATAHDASRIVAKVKKFWSGPVSVTPNLHVLTPLAIPFHDMPGVPTANAWLLSRYIRHHARRLGMDTFQMVGLGCCKSRRAHSGRKAKCQRLDARSNKRYRLRNRFPTKCRGI